MILLAGLFLAGYIFDFLSDDFALVGEFNEELGPLFGPLLYWAFFLALLWALFVFGKSHLWHIERTFRTPLCEFWVSALPQRPLVKTTTKFEQQVQARGSCL